MVGRDGIDLITEFEGLPNGGLPYNDPVGHCTIGYGHLIHYGPCTKSDYRAWPNGLKKAEALALLRKDLVKYEKAVDRLVKVPLTPYQRDALISWTYNLGEGALAASTLLKKLNARDYIGAEAEFHRWVKAGGQTLPGLVRRRKAEAELFGRSSVLPLNKNVVRRYQQAHNRFRAKWKVPGKKLAVDGVLGPNTKASIKEDKFLLGYAPKYVVWSTISDAFLRRLAHPTFGLNPAQIARGVSRRRAYRRRNLSTIPGCAKFLLASPNVSFWDGLSTGSDRKNFERLAAGKPAYVPARGTYVYPRLNLMRALVDIAQHGSVMINALTGGSHSVNSNHYAGKAVDLDLSVGDTAEIERLIRKHGGKRNFETDHVHADFL